MEEVEVEEGEEMEVKGVYEGNRHGTNTISIKVQETGTSFFGRNMQMVN